MQMMQEEREETVLEINDDEQLVCQVCNNEIGVEDLENHPCFNKNGPISEPKQSIKEYCSDDSLENKLIELIQNRPIIWDITIPLNKRPINEKENLWKEIHVCFRGKYSIEFLKKKWKYLRDQYIKTKDEVDGYVPSGSGSTSKKKVWKHYEVLKFLSDSVKPRRTTTNLSSQQNKTEHLKDTKDKKRKRDGIDTDIIDAIKSIPPPVPPAPVQQGPRVNPVCIQISDILEKLPLSSRATLEIKFLREAYDELLEHT